MMQKNEVLYSIIAPDMDIAVDESMYYRTTGLAYYSPKEDMYVLKSGSSVCFDTYFNSFSLGKWRHHTSLEQLSFSIKYKGHILVKVFHINGEKLKALLHTHELLSQNFDQEILPVLTDSRLQDGLLYIEVIALEASSLAGMSYCTSDKASKTIKLGVVITTFNREQVILKTIERLEAYLESSDIECTVCIVDNGKTLAIKDSRSIKIVPNANLGGSGGFARGLYHFKEENSEVTHCLFMDDDASCELESIRRTYKLLEYAKDDRVAIAGSMMLESSPAIQHEKGAQFNRFCRPISMNLALTNIDNLVENEIETPIDYGGWWFFAFPIVNVSYPYPFFVRGDDVDFCFRNDFRILTLNGIGSWQEDFFYKETPLQVYLDARSHLLHHMHFKQLDQSNIVFLQLLLRFVAVYTLCYQYKSALATIEALEDVLKGPSVFEENILMKKVFTKLSPLVQAEKIKPIELNEQCKSFETYKAAQGKSQRYMKVPDLYRVLYEKNKEESFYDSKFNKILKLLTLNGHLLPRIFFKKPIILEKTHMKYGMIFRRPAICMFHASTNEGKILTHSKKEFWTTIIKFLAVSMRFMLKKEKLMSEYQQTYGRMTSKAFWKMQFDKQEE